MMSPEGGPEPARHHEGDAGAAPSPAATERHEAPAGLLMQLDAVFAAYLDALKALGRDEMESARKAGGAVQAALEAVDMGLLDGPAHAAWMVEERSLAKSADDLARAGDLARAREAFGALSETLIAVARRFGAPGGRPLFRYHCPMAFGNRGADWLTLTREVENPFFGAAMPRCGEVVETIPAAWRQSGRREGPGETARGQGDGR